MTNHTSRAWIPLRATSELSVVLAIACVRVAQRPQLCRRLGGEGVAIQAVEVRVPERGQPGGSLVAHGLAAAAQALHDGVEVTGIPQHDGVEDQAESGELIFVRAIFIALLTPFIARLAGSGAIDTRLLLFAGFSMIGISQLWLSHVTTTLDDFGSLTGPAILGGIGYLAGPVIGKGQMDPEAVHGGAYAPYVVERWTKLRGSELSVYYLLSTWNPYVVVLMKSRLQVE